MSQWSKLELAVAKAIQPDIFEKDQPWNLRASKDHVDDLQRMCLEEARRAIEVVFTWLANREPPDPGEGDGGRAAL